MYPYNRTTQLGTAASETKETLQKKHPSTNAANPADDRRILEILDLAEMDTRAMAQRYTRMMEDETLSPSMEALRMMQLNELKHQKLLQEARYLIGGKTMSSIPSTKMSDVKGKELIEETLLLELGNGDFFRSLYLAMPTTELRDIFYEIAANKQSHSTGLSYLFSKYFC